MHTTYSAKFAQHSHWDHKYVIKYYWDRKYVHCSTFIAVKEKQNWHSTFNAAIFRKIFVHCIHSSHCLVFAFTDVTIHYNRCSHSTLLIVKPPTRYWPVWPKGRNRTSDPYRPPAVCKVRCQKSSIIRNVQFQNGRSQVLNSGKNCCLWLLLTLGISMVIIYQIFSYFNMSIFI